MHRVVAPAPGIAEVTAVAAPGMMGAVMVAVDDDDMALAPVEGAVEKYRRDGDAMPPVKVVAGMVAPGWAPIKMGVVGPPPTGKEHQGIVIGHVHHLGVARLDDDQIPVPIGAGVLQGFQVPGGVGLVPQALDGVDHVGFLQQVGIAEILGPVEVLVHPRQHLGEGHQGLDARVPAHALGGAHRLGALEPRARGGPAGRFHHFEGVG